MQTRDQFEKAKKRLSVVVPSITKPIQPSPGFEKKGLAEYKLDLLALCGFGCAYCSSNEGNYLRIHREEFRKLTIAQTGLDVVPADSPGLTFEWPDVIEKLEAQLARKPRTWGAGLTLVFSMLTDGFSPRLVQSGLTRRALDLIIERTSFRIRVLTKNACVGSRGWIEFFAEHADRFVVGLSTGTLDDGWAKRVEIGTSPPSKRLEALRRLQDAGVSTYGMLCPVFPDVLHRGDLDRLVEQIRPRRCETIWAEPYNDRTNWRRVQQTYPSDSRTHTWFTAAFETRGGGAWSEYAIDLYERLRAIAERDGWLDRLKYLLYEANLSPEFAPRLRDLAGVSLQSDPGGDGFSKSEAVAELQRAIAERTTMTPVAEMAVAPGVAPVARDEDREAAAMPEVSLDPLDHLVSLLEMQVADIAMHDASLASLLRPSVGGLRQTLTYERERRVEKRAAKGVNHAIGMRERQEATDRAAMAAAMVPRSRGLPHEWLRREAPHVVMSGPPARKREV
jgi:DNA repair photolyase